VFNLSDDKTPKYEETIELDGKLFTSVQIELLAREAKNQFIMFLLDDLLVVSDLAEEQDEETCSNIETALAKIREAMEKDMKKNIKLIDAPLVLRSSKIKILSKNITIHSPMFMLYPSSIKGIMFGNSRDIFDNLFGN
jgi:hypothetical protein